MTCCGTAVSQRRLHLRALRRTFGDRICKGYLEVEHSWAQDFSLAVVSCTCILYRLGKGS